MNTENTTHNSALILLAILALALNLRPAIAAIGPLADLLETHTGLNSTGIGLLTMLPIFFMGVGALCIKWLRTTFGEKQGITVGAALITMSCFGRIWLNTDIGLVLTAVAAGMGIATVQALLPAVIKRSFGVDTGRIIGFYSSAIVGGAALAAASSAQLANYVGWSEALAFWGVPALLAMVLWLFAGGDSNEAEQIAAMPRVEKIPFWWNARSWSLLFFFGIATGAFMLILAWLPPFYVALGKSREFAGYLLAGFTVVELITALIISSIIHRYPDRRGPLVASLMTVIAGLACLVLMPVKLVLAAVVLLGVGIGILFPLSLIVTVDHIDNPTRAGDFTAFVTGGGYIIASFMPLLAGWLRDIFADLSQAWLLMAIGISFLLLLAVRYSPASYSRFTQAIRED